MQKVFTLIQNYFTVSVLCFFTIVLVALGLIFLHEKNRTDMQLIEDVQELIKNQERLIHIPHGWEIEAENTCLQHHKQTLSYTIKQGIQRKIVYPYTHHDTKFCISKQLPIQWTVYHNVLLIIIGGVTIGFWILLFFVIQMYVFARIWKYIVQIQHVCKSTEFEHTSIVALQNLEHILITYKQSPRIHKMLQSEFQLVFKQLQIDIQFHVEQKKIPDICYREFLHLYKTLQISLY